MTIQQAFQNYRDENISFGYCPGREINEALLILRQEVTVMSADDIKYIIGYLGHNEHRWFVFRLTLVLKSLPLELFTPLMDSLLSLGADDWRKDLVHDNIARLYGFLKVEKYLQEEFTSSYSEIYKRSIFWAMKRNSYSIEFIIPDDDLHFIIEYKYEWEKDCYRIKGSLPDSQENAEVMLLNQDTAIQNRYCLILEYLINHEYTPNFLNDCREVLPNKLEMYVGESKVLYGRFLTKLENSKKPENSKPHIYFNEQINDHLNYWKW